MHADHPISRLIAGSHRGVTATFGAEWTLVGSRYPTDRGQISNVGQETEGQAFWKFFLKMNPKLTNPGVLGNVSPGFAGVLLI